MLQAGATPYRCAACRCNFASFRGCKEKFAWRHKTRIEIGAGRPGVLGAEAVSLNNLSSSLLAAGSNSPVMPDLVSHDHDSVNSLSDR